ncbi:MAG: RNA methyltransferase [Lachnospiraceae bacterium]|nr:RNA methyltransferase [Lachnospiraceae bacterium]
MITSTSNGKIKKIIKYAKSAKERRKADVFLVEGIRMFLEIPVERMLETYVTKDFYEKNSNLLEQIDYELVADHVMDAITDTKSPQGVVSVVRRLHYRPEEVCGLEKDQDGEQQEKPLIIVLENLQDPGNLGTIIRTAEGAGVTGVLMSRDTVDIYNPKVIRSTMGSVFRVPFCYVENLVEWMNKLNALGFATYGAHLQGTSFYDQNYKKATVFAIGNEGNGLTIELLKAANQKIWIPMRGKVESLNAATASTVLMYEAMRQRYTTPRQN